MFGIMCVIDLFGSVFSLFSLLQVNIDQLKNYIYLWLAIQEGMLVGVMNRSV